MPDECMEQGWHPASDTYRASLDAERRIYTDCADVHDLPPIFHYWSNQHIRTKLREYGYESAADLFAKELGAQCGHAALFVSLGSGNCDFELDLARLLRIAGHSNFVIECADLNRAMLDRGAQAVRSAGLAEHFVFTEADLNSWCPEGQYDGVIANQSLHHVLNLEGLFAQVRECLSDNGVFLISDMIGRNGHQRWPEALRLLKGLWKQLPPSYRVNRRFGYYEESYEDWDCSGEGFEGVRSQDILPLLVEQFSFRFFFPFGNLIDVFVDRAFGPNFNAASENDCRFIDFVHGLDEDGLKSGRLTPTHLLAVLGKNVEVAPVYRDGLEPAACVRSAEHPALLCHEDFACPVFAVDTEKELAVFVERMAQARETIRARMNWALTRESELQERNRWALRLDEELEAVCAEYTKRGTWALGLEGALQRSETALALLQDEFEQRTRWALSMRDEDAIAAAQLDYLTTQVEEQKIMLQAQSEELERLTERAWFSRWLNRVAARTLKVLRV